MGNRAIHLPTTLELSNQPNPSVLQYGSLLGENILSPDVVAAGFTPPYPEFVQQFGGSAILEQALTPYPQFGGYFPVNEMDGTAFYNALQVQSEKRFAGGLAYLASLTLARNESNQQVGSGPFSWNGMNAYAPQLEYVTFLWLDQLYMVKLVGTYELPFGRGKKYLGSGTSRVGAGGWMAYRRNLELSGRHSIVDTNNYNPLLVNSFDRPNTNQGGAAKDVQLWQIEGVLSPAKQRSSQYNSQPMPSKTPDLGRLAIHSVLMRRASTAFENRELRRNQSLPYWRARASQFAP